MLELFWPDAEPKRARDSLKTALWSVRRAIRDGGNDPDAFVAATKSTVRWIAPTMLDADELTALATKDDPQADRAAVALYGGDFLDADYGEWASSERERFAALFETALSRMVVATDDVAIARQLLERNPYDERAYATLIDAEIAAGRENTARVIFERCRRALVEFGAEPSIEFAARYRELAADTDQTRAYTVAFAGRAHELGELHALCRRFAAGERGYVLLHGDAGSGKSTLLRRLEATLARDDVAAVWIVGVDEDPRAFGPFGATYETLTGIPLVQLVARAGDGIVAALAGGIADALPIGATLALDDAQSLGLQARDVLVELARRVVERGHPVVVAARPEGVTELRVALLGITLHDIALGDLTAEDVADIVRVSARQPIPELAAALYERTRGHPLFVASLLEDLARSGALRRDGPAWSVAADLSRHLVLPASLVAFVEARLRSRGNDAASVACALALEPDASADDLGAALRLDEPQVLDALDDLLRLGVIVERDDGTSFRYVHDAVREVAARLLNAGRRARLHRAFAARLDGAVTPDAGLRRARHLNASGMRLEAGLGFEHAAVESLSWSAFRDAAQRAREGIATVERLARSSERDATLAKLHFRLAGALEFDGRPAEAFAAATDGLAYARTSANDDIAVTALFRRASASEDLERYDDALADFRDGERLSRKLAVEEWIAKALLAQVVVLMPLGRHAEARAAGEEAFAIAERIDAEYMAAGVAAQLVEVALLRTDFKEAARWADVAIERGRRAPPSSLALAHRANALLAYALERYALVDEHLELALAFERQQRQEVFGQGGFGSGLWMFACLYLRGVARAATAEWDAALADAEAVVAGAPALAGLSKYANPLRLLRIDALLGRGAAADIGEVAIEAERLAPVRSLPTTLGWSDLPELAGARVAARLRRHDASALLQAAFDRLETRAAVARLDADRSFAKLAAAADEAGDLGLRDKASQRARALRADRIGVAGPLWGGAPM